MATDTPLRLKDGREVEIRPAVGRFEGFATVVGPKTPGVPGCWCMSYREATKNLEDRIEHMRDECAHEPGPGILAYVGDEVAGWCSVAPRSSYARLMRSRTIPFVDDRDPWSVVCFVVRPGYRKQGMLHVLLQGAVDHVRAQGGGVLEGYPVDTSEAGRVDGISGYVGSTDMFERAGFERVELTSSNLAHRERWLMRKTVRAKR